MIKNYVFNLPTSSKDNMVRKFDLQEICSNSRTSIWQNKEMRFCIDKRVVRVILFNENNEALLEKLRGYFYGEEYKKLY